MMIDLRSDTVTRPTAAMKDFMMQAPVGDDVFSEDPSINELEEKVATMFGKEAAVFCPSGTMTNQIAVKTHTKPMDEVIIEKSNHIYYYEAGGIAFNSLASVRLISGDRGRIKSEDIIANINPINLHHARTTLVCIENTSNRGGGSYYSKDELQKLSDTAHKAGLRIHLDGARLFNALVETGINTLEIGNMFDSISICLSKGLGCPVGSVLTGSKDFISEARRYRKVMGGGMRQAGIIAAAGIYALDHHIERLKEDHRRAKEIETVLNQCAYVEEVFEVMTNIIIFRLKPSMPADVFVNKLKQHQIYCFSIGNQQIRFVTHLDFSDSMLQTVSDKLKQIA
jgi:threonine aldolase